MRNDLLRRLPVEQAAPQNYGGGRHRLRVLYKKRDLVILGLGVMIGAGIFKISGVQAATAAGPAVIASFVIAGTVCLLAALCFAELSSAVPVAGSAYSFGYVAFGELWAWFIGWALILELLLAACAVARAWSLIAVQTLQDLSIGMPSGLAGVVGQERGFDVFALAILVLLIGLLASGSRVGLRTLWAMVLAKLLVIGLVIVGGLLLFDAGNLTPFVPPARPAPGGGEPTVLTALFGDPSQTFGIWGIFAATPAIAFAYIGFDLIATAAEETEDAPRKVPQGLLTSLVITIVLYVGVAVAMVGMISYRELDPARPPFAQAFAEAGAGWMGTVTDIGAVLGLTTVIFVVLISLTRVVFSMARDGLLPSGLAAVSRYQVPSRATLVAGGTAVVLSQTVDVLTLEPLVVIGALFAFLAVSAAVPALRRVRPDLRPPFRVPGGATIPMLAMASIAWLMLNLELKTWSYFGVWMLAGFVFYLLYGRRHSRLRELLDRPPAPATALSSPPPARSPFDVPPISPQAGPLRQSPLDRPFSAPAGVQPSPPYPSPGESPWGTGSAHRRPEGPYPHPSPQHAAPPRPQGAPPPHAPSSFQEAAPPRPQSGPPFPPLGGSGRDGEFPQDRLPRGPRPYVQGGRRPWGQTPAGPADGDLPYPEEPGEPPYGGYHRP